MRGLARCVCLCSACKGNRILDFIFVSSTINWATDARNHFNSECLSHLKSGTEKSLADKWRGGYLKEEGPCGGVDGGDTLFGLNGEVFSFFDFDSLLGLFVLRHSFALFN